jgi:hypothetical protein
MHGIPVSAISVHSSLSLINARMRERHPALKECVRAKEEFFRMETGFAGSSVPNQVHVANGQMKKTW